MNLTLANKNPFSTFDFLGYFFPGALLLLLTYILSDGLDLLDTPKSVMRLKELTQCYPVIGGLTLVIISYVIGHLVSYMSSSTVELFYVWCHGYPSTFLLQQNPTLEPILKSSKGRLGMIWHIAVCIVIFPIVIAHCLFERVLGLHRFITKALNKPLQDELKTAEKKVLKELGIQDETINHEEFNNAHLVVMHYVYEHCLQHQVKFDNYVALYGFLRSISLVFSLSVIYLLYGYFHNDFTFVSDNKVISWLINVYSQWGCYLSSAVIVILLTSIIFLIYFLVNHYKKKGYHTLDMLLSSMALSVLVMILTAILVSTCDNVGDKWQILVFFALAYLSYLGFGKFYRRFTLEDYMAMLSCKTKPPKIDNVKITPEIDHPIHVIIDQYGLINKKTMIEINKSTLE